jgi:hypothetical protein
LLPVPLLISDRPIHTTHAHLFKYTPPKKKQNKPAETPNSAERKTPTGKMLKENTLAERNTLANRMLLKRKTLAEIMMLKGKTLPKKTLTEKTKPTSGGSYARTDDAITVEYPESGDLPSSRLVSNTDQTDTEVFPTLETFTLQGKVGVMTGGARGLRLVIGQGM